MTERLDVRSPLARHVLPETGWMTDPKAIRAELERVGRVAEMLRVADAKAVGALLGELSHIKDIRRTVERLDCGETPDDIELYEIKALALSAARVAGGLSAAGVDVVAIPDLTEVAAILDPDGCGVAHFYVYDSYSPELAESRRSLKEAEGEERERLFGRCEELENTVRIWLAGRLRPYAGGLRMALEEICRLDILLAKARQAREMSLARPEIAEGGNSSYEGLFNPRTAETLGREGKRFQPVDVCVTQGPTLITGANMGGKTVVLRSVALAQALCQFGFFVPAAEAVVVPVDDVALLCGDDAYDGGLSSFGREIVRLNELTGKVRAGKRVLALLDEPARTTNPVEGKALVAALLDFLTENRVPSLVTTHFSGIGAHVRRLRVKGFRVDGRDIGIEEIQDYMDYSLVEDASDEAPREALRIARMLGLDDEVGRRAEHYMDAER